MTAFTERYGTCKMGNSVFYCVYAVILLVIQQCAFFGFFGEGRGKREKGLSPTEEAGHNKVRLWSRQRGYRDFPLRNSLTVGRLPLLCIFRRSAISYIAKQKDSCKKTTRFGGYEV
jgi:hypothetical protein